MSSSLKYSVEIEYLSRGLDGNAMSKVKGSTDNWLRGVGKGIEGLTGTFNDVFDSAASKMVSSLVDAAKIAGAAIGASLGYAVHEAFKFNQEMENATLAMGAIFGANGVGAKEGIDPLVTGMRLAQLSVQEMRKDARDLPGEFKDLQNIMTTIASPAAQAGLDATGIEKLSSKAMVAGAVLNVPQQVVAREMAMMLAGNARHSMPLFARLGLGDAKDFNKLGAYERFQKVSGGLDKIYKSKDMFSNTWSALSSNAMDTLRQGAGAVGNPLFEAVKGKLKYALGVGVDPGSDEGRKRSAFIEKATDVGIKVGDYLAKGFEKAFQVGQAAMAKWYQPAKNFVGIIYDGFHAVFVRVKPMIDSLLGSVAGFFQNFRISDFDQFAKIAATLAGVRVGSGMLGGIGGNLSGLGSMMKGLEGIGVGSEAVVAAAPMLAVALAGLAFAAYGVAHSFLDSTSIFHGIAVAQLTSISQILVDTGSNLSTFGRNIEPIADLLGNVMLTSINGVVFTLDALAWGLSAMTTTVKADVEFLKSIIPNSWKGGVPDQKKTDQDFFTSLEDEAAARRRNMFSERYSSDKVFNPDGKDLAAMKPPNVTNHNNFQIKIEVNGTEDPDRVAKTVWKEFENLSRFPTTTATTGDRVRDARSY